MVGQGGVGVVGQGGGARRARDVRLRQHRTLSLKLNVLIFSTRAEASKKQFFLQICNRDNNSNT